MWETLEKEFAAKLLSLLFIVLTFWWISLNASGLQNSAHNYAFGATYGIIALIGGITGLRISARWGLTRSVMGKAILFLSLGLLAQEFGQLAFSYYNIFKNVEVPYPSIADVGFFGNIPLYIFGVFLLSKAAGGQFSLKRFSGKLQVVLLPLALIAVSYYLFLQEYSFENTPLLQIFLDFGYPMGQAMYLALALLTYTLSKNFLGGVMKGKILFIIAALIAQYIADFNFLYQNLNETWVNAGYGDYLYLIAYLLMALGILQLKTVLAKLRHSGD